jgi:hypothetical protein
MPDPDLTRLLLVVILVLMAFFHVPLHVTSCCISLVTEQALDFEIIHA